MSRLDTRSVACIVLLAACSGSDTTADERPWHAPDCPAGTTLQGEGPTDRVRWCATADGRPEGPWLSLHEDGTPASEGLYVDGKRRGPFRMWYEGGPVAMVSELDGGNGRLVVKGRSGDDLATITVRNHRWDPALRHETHHGGDPSRLESRTWRLGNEQHGPFEAFHPDGAPWIRGEHLMGKKHGPWVHFSLDGTADVDFPVPQ